MRRRFVIVVALVSALGCTLAQGIDEEMRHEKAERRAQSVARAGGERQALVQAIRAWDVAHNAGDVEALVALYAPDAISLPFERPTVHGREAIEADFRAFFADYRAEHHTTVDDLLVVGDLSVERGAYTFRMTPIAGGEAYREGGKHVMVRERRGGDWLIVWEIWNTDAPPD